MNYRTVFHYLFIILITLSVAFAASLCVSLYYPTKFEETAEIGWIACLAINTGIAVIFYILGRHGDHKIFRREALCIIGLGWILSCAIGSLPYWFIIPEMSIFDAIFESTSGLTTTGATVINDIEDLPPSILFWRALSQWIGGMGVVMFFVALLSFVGAGAKILYSHESSAQSADLDSSRIQRGLFKIFLIYLVLSVLNAFLFYAEGMTTFDAICHMFTTVSTGGFSTKNASIGYFENPWIEWTSIFFMITGGMSFLLLLKVTEGKLSSLWKNTEWVLYLLILITFSALTATIIEAEYTDISYADAFRVSFFQVTSLMTTSGFSTIDYDRTAHAAHVFLMLLMIMGSCSGSTSGGLKLIRIIAGAKVVYHHIERAFRPRIVRTLRIDRKPLSNMAQESIMTYIATAFLLFAITLFLITVLQPNMSFEGSFSTTLACLFNIGPGFAEVGPAKTYAFMDGWNKVFLSFLMILGRLEFFAILVLFMPSFWRRFN